MNKENAKDYLPLVQALAEGKTIQIADPELGKELNWVDAEDFDFCLPISFYRIKPEPKKIHLNIALHKDASGYWCTLVTGNSIAHLAHVEKNESFLEWIYNLEYTLPEGDA